mgnify:CR=1 FL=1
MYPLHRLRGETHPCNQLRMRWVMLPMGLTSRCGHSRPRKCAVAIEKAENARLRWPMTRIAPLKSRVEYLWRGKGHLGRNRWLWRKVVRTCVTGRRLYQIRSPRLTYTLRTPTALSLFLPRPPWTPVVLSQKSLLWPVANARITPLHHAERHSLTQGQIAPIFVRQHGPALVKHDPSLLHQ